MDATRSIWLMKFSSGVKLYQKALRNNTYNYPDFFLPGVHDGVGRRPVLRTSASVSAPAPNTASKAPSALFCSYDIGIILKLRPQRRSAIRVARIDHDSKLRNIYPASDIDLIQHLGD